MNEICFVTGNKNKLREVQNLLTNYKIVSLDDLNFSEDIAETENTIQGNAELKASFIYNKYNIDCFSDDTGLFIDSLGGLPGVKSARYAGEKKDFALAMKKLNEELKFKENKSCKFTCALSLCWPDGYNITVQGEVYGEFTWPPSGNNGFGYDAIFFYPELKKTFGELDPSIKHNISHRSLAFKKLKTEIKKIINE